MHIVPFHISPKKMARRSGAHISLTTFCYGYDASHNNITLFLFILIHVTHKLFSDVLCLFPEMFNLISREMSHCWKDLGA